MEKSFKKELENEINGTLVQLLSSYNKSAVLELKEAIKYSGKVLSKKFSKEIKKIEKAKLKIAKAKPSVKTKRAAKKNSKKKTTTK
jgi:hypothetical protein